MDNLARPPQDDDLGDVFVRKILSDGSLAVITPLLHFLTNSNAHTHLRPSGKSTRAALFADIAHFMHVSHGRHPGIVEHAAQKMVDDAGRAWVINAINGMLSERAFLNTLTVTAGPIRRLSSHNKVNALVDGQAKNFEMLATSERLGCPSGAAIAFVLDWLQTRPLLDILAHEMGLDPQPVTLPPITECVQFAQKLDQSVGYRRAMAFGAEQTLAQQRGLWQLVVARHVEMRAS